MSQPSSQREEKCPICARPASARYRPFCTARCADVDLGRWLNEAYRIPARPGWEEEEDGPSSGQSDC